MDEFYSIDNLKNLSDDDQKRIKYLRIPPNWTTVKISKDPSSKVQVTGNDARGRTQYIYHPVWVQFSKDTKYSKVDKIDFNKFENIIKRYCDFNGNYTKNYIIANMFIIMKDLNIRVGNEKYLEENDSVGLCTLSKSHYKKTRNKESNQSSQLVHKLIFKGKKGVMHEKILNSNHVKFIDNIIVIPGKSLFKYANDVNNKNSYKKIVADDLNNFLKEYVDKYMTCKDIRTHYANIIYQREYKKFINDGHNEKKARIEAIKITASELGNTPKVCRDSYINLEK